MLSGNVTATQSWRSNGEVFKPVPFSGSAHFCVISFKSLQTAIWVEFCISEHKNTPKGTTCVYLYPAAHRGFVTGFQLPGLELHSLLPRQRRSKREPVYGCLPGVWWESAGTSVCTYPFPGLTCFIQGCKCSCQQTCVLSYGIEGIQCCCECF